MLNKILLKIFGVKLVCSQYGEDLIIESLLPQKKDGFYIDIGANHPIKYSNTFLFYRKGWKGINVEPNPSRIWLFNIFRKRDLNLNIGIGKNKSEINFYIFKESTLSTFDKIASEEYKSMGHPIKKVIKIPITPLSEIIEKHANQKEIDILSIDTEGYDMEVLESNDWNKFRPRFLIIETLEYKKDGAGKKLNNIFDPYTEKIGYRKIADTYINTIYEKNY
jgi:FkbM family methyltransferase